MEHVIEAVAKDIVDAALKVHKELVRDCLNPRIKISRMRTA